MTEPVEVQYATFEDILEKVSIDKEEDFTTSYNITVRLRGLSRAEYLWASKAKEDPQELEVRLLTKGLLQPKLTREQIKKWQTAGYSQAVAEITDKIGELSGMFEGADKSDL